MRDAARFLTLLLLGLAGLTGLGYAALTRTAREWFEADLELRSRLAVAAARQGLRQHWASGSERLTSTLNDITRDERVMGAAACGSDGRLLAATASFPQELSCQGLLAKARGAQEAIPSSWSTTAELSSGRVHVSVSALEASSADGRTVQGAIVLVHDLSHLLFREVATRNMLLGAFFALGLLASLLTLGAVRLAWRGWTQRLRAALTGEAPREFQPLVRDVRGLVERLAREQEREGRGGRWSAERLKSTLVQHLQDERVVILANREPYIHQRQGDAIIVQHPASGLVTALEPVMRACSGVWVAHGSGSADREVVDAKDRVKVPPGEESYQVRRVWLSPEEEDGYYYGFSNEGLWPLCHVAHTRPTFRASDWEHYVRVNQRFARAVVDEVDSDDPIILVQDYHFALAPAEIRKRLPKATILTFWHIPWPNSERFGICPWGEEIIQGLLGSSILGFHTQQHCSNFIDSVDAYLESRIDRERSAVIQGARSTLVRPYPISIEWPVRWMRDLPSVAECRQQVRAEWGLPADTLLGVGIDRLDYTKGIEERLLAVEELLVRYPELKGRFTFAQLAAPSRTKIGPYRELNERVEAQAARINERLGGAGAPPILLLRRHHEPKDVFAACRAADLCYVSSLHDGMNLVAKEFVAARDDEQGVLVLSKFTGAARDLTEALIVNPYDLRQAAEAMAVALRMPAEEQRERMRAMRRLVSEFNVYRWAGRMLVDAAELRRRERVAGRLSWLPSAMKDADAHPLS